MLNLLVVITQHVLDLRFHYFILFDFWHFLFLARNLNIITLFSWWVLRLLIVSMTRSSFILKSLFLQLDHSRILKHLNHYWILFFNLLYFSIFILILILAFICLRHFFHLWWLGIQKIVIAIWIFRLLWFLNIFIIFISIGDKLLITVDARWCNSSWLALCKKHV